MDIYFDTSSLAKLYIDEPDSPQIHEMVESASSFVTSWISYVEMHSLLNRRLRTRQLSLKEKRIVKNAFDEDWSHFGKNSVTTGILKHASLLLDVHPLRSLDAIHLATALKLEKESDGTFIFITADRQLEAAARREKLTTRI